MTVPRLRSIHLVLNRFLDSLRVPKRVLLVALSAAKRSPLTLQSYLLIAFCCYLLSGPVPVSSDIICASLAWGLLATIGIIAAITTVHALRIKKLLTSVELFLPEESLLAQQSARHVLSFPALRLLPGALLECELDFVHHFTGSTQVRLHGSWNTQRRVPFDLTFPHRGNWDIHGIRCRVGDLSGFIRVSWTIPQQTSVTVSPSIPNDTNLPLVSSTQRPGDLTPDTVHRYGDPFDIKPYHPSDGMKKIVWKAYAKSGQLLSRHPEPSMTPEGFVAICVLARPEDDVVCGAALAYVEALIELKLEILVGCEGHNGRDLGTDVASAKTLLIDSVWDATNANEIVRVADLQAIIDHCSDGDSRITLRKIVIFCSGSRVSEHDDAHRILSHAAWLEAQGIEPIFFLTQPEAFVRRDTPRLSEKLRGLFVEPDEQLASLPSPSAYKGFLTTCAARQWEVFI